MLSKHFPLRFLGNTHHAASTCTTLNVFVVDNELWPQKAPNVYGRAACFSSDLLERFRLCSEVSTWPAPDRKAGTSQKCKNSQKDSACKVATQTETMMRIIYLNMVPRCTCHITSSCCPKSLKAHLSKSLWCKNMIINRRRCFWKVWICLKHVFRLCSCAPSCLGFISWHKKTLGLVSWESHQQSCRFLFKGLMMPIYHYLSSSFISWHLFTNIYHLWPFICRLRCRLLSVVCWLLFVRCLRYHRFLS